MTFADKLKSERLRTGLTQPDAAGLLEVPQRTLWEWEHGKTEPYKVTQEGALARFAKLKTKRGPKR
jgi:transcriptional regulator with XRE-family HTH domain